MNILRTLLAVILLPSLCCFGLTGCATSSSAPPKLTAQESGISGLWRSATPSVPDYYAVILRRPDGTFIKKYEYEGRTSVEPERRYAGLWRMADKQITYSVFKVFENGVWKKSLSKSITKETVQKIDANRIETVSKDQATNIEVRIADQANAIDPVFEQIPLVDKAANDAIK